MSTTKKAGHRVGLGIRTWSLARLWILLAYGLLLLFSLVPMAASADDTARPRMPANPGRDGMLALDNPDQVGRILLTIDKSQTRRVDRPFAEALIANAEIADVVPLTDRALYVIGKRIGMTRLTLIDANKRLLAV